MSAKRFKSQLAKLADYAPEGEDWVFEPKLDGYRIAARIEGKNIQLLTRTGLDGSSKYPAAVQALSRIKAKAAYIDGELCAIDDKGLPNFNLMPNAHAVDANSNQHSEAVKTSCSAEDAICEAAEDHRPRPVVATRNNTLDKADARHRDQQ